MSTMSKQELPARPAALTMEASRMFLAMVGRREQMYDPWDSNSEESFIKEAQKDQTVIKFLKDVATDAKAATTSPLGKPTCLT